MKKFLAISTMPGEPTPFQAYQHAQSHFSFVDANSPSCFVMPYMIITDGRDIFVFETPDRNVEMGFRFFVPKPKKIPTGPEAFDQIVEEAVYKHFMGMWSGIKTQVHAPDEIKYDLKLQKINKVGVKYADLDNEFINVHATNRGVYSLTKKKFLPIYFLVLPNNRSIGLIPAEADHRPIPVEFKHFSLRSDQLPLSYMTKVVVDMVTSGEILFPIVLSTTKEFPEDL